MNDALLLRWTDLVGVWAVNSETAIRSFRDVCQHYGEAGRFYHTLAHIEAMLDTAESLAQFASNLNALKLAVWLHDVIYDSKASDNEEHSAQFAEALCQQLSIPEGRVVSALILKTKTHVAADDRDAKVLLDADLAILGADETAYWTYADQIR